MNCKKCGRHAVCCKERWVNKNAMVVEYFCFWHAPKHAEYFYDGNFLYLVLVALLFLSVIVSMLIKLIAEVVK